MTFISLCCLIAEARTSSFKLSNSGESRHPCHVPDLRENALSFSLLRMILAVGLSYMVFMISRYDPSIPMFLSVFIKKGCCILSNAFSATIFFFNVYFFLGQRETEHERGRGRERGRHRIGNRLQALSHQPRARRGARTHGP